MKIINAGIFDISAEEYHSDPCLTPSLSSSIVKILVNETPLHAWTAHPRLNPNFEHDDDDKFVIGNVAHSLMLRDPKNFAILDFDTYQSKAAKEARDAARAAGRIPIKAKDWPRVVTMVEAGREQLEWHADFADHFAEGRGKPEQTLIWSEGTGADLVWMRIRLDWLPDDHDRPYPDYKTTESADPETWSRVIFGGVRHDIQAAFYRRGIRALGLCRQPRMRFVVQETTEPHCLTVNEMSAGAMEEADKDIERAIRRWRWCRENGRWPGYVAKVHTITPPPWFDDKREAERLRLADNAKDAGTDPDMLAASFQRQAPDHMGEPF